MKLTEFRDWVIFRWYVHKKNKYFGQRIYKIPDMTGYTYKMKLYIGKKSPRMQLTK
jgi:hypothetical protein